MTTVAGNAGGRDGEVARAAPAPETDHDAITRDLATAFAELATIGRDPSGGYRRLAYTAEDLELREWFHHQAAARHLDVHEDRAGNLWAWWGDPTAGGAVATGSHLDSVRRGGAYDGPLGVVSAFLAVDELRRRGVDPVRPLAIAAFADEEGARFGIACAGSRLLTGQLTPERANVLTDDDGVTLAQARRQLGRAAPGPDPEVLRSLGSYVELHVEQGRGLVELDAPVGVATAIRAHGRWRFDLEGRADHAGTTRMADRDDPMLRHAEVVLAARQAALDHDAVATVGRVGVDPGSVNAIAHRVRTWLDVRADDERTVRAVVAMVARAAGGDPEEESWTPRVDLDAGLRDELVAVLAPRFGAVPVLPTGAGHDAGILALAGIPTAMLFVRNPTGVSHAPEEHAEPPDQVAGVLALADVLAHLCQTPGGWHAGRLTADG